MVYPNDIPLSERSREMLLYVLNIFHIVANIGRAGTHLNSDRLPHRCSASTLDKRAVLAFLCNAQLFKS